MRRHRNPSAAARTRATAPADTGHVVHVYVVTDFHMTGLSRQHVGTFDGWPAALDVIGHWPSPITKITGSYVTLYTDTAALDLRARRRHLMAERTALAARHPQHAAAILDGLYTIL